MNFEILQRKTKKQNIQKSI